MKPFQYIVAADVPSAVAQTVREAGGLFVWGDSAAQFFAGGTSQVDLMQEGVQRPDLLVDISQLGFAGIEATPSGGLRIGANVKNSVAADHPLPVSRYQRGAARRGFASDPQHGLHGREPASAHPLSVSARRG